MSELVGAGGTGQEIAAAVFRLSYLSGLEVPQVSIFDSDVAPTEAGSSVFSRSQILQDLHEKLLTFGVIDAPHLEMIDPTEVEGAVSPIATVADLFSQFGHLEVSDKYLLDLLLDPVQQQTAIRNGFHGQPAVGSLIFASALQRGGFRDFRDRLQEAAKAEEGLRLVFAGSLGGGVGTATIPILIGEFSDIRNQNPDRHIEILGLFQVPWFRLVQVPGDDLSQKPDVTQAMLDRNSACLVRGYLEQAMKGAMDAAMMLGLPDSVDRVSHGGERQLETKHYLCLISGVVGSNLLRATATEKMLGTNVKGFYAPTLDVATKDQDPPDSEQEGMALFLDVDRRLTIHDLVDLSRSLCAVTESLLFELEVQTPVSAHHGPVSRTLGNLRSSDQKRDFHSTIRGLHGLHIEIRDWLRQCLDSKVGSNRADTLGAFAKETADLDEFVSASAKDVLKLMRATRLLPPLGRRILRQVKPLGTPTSDQRGRAAAWALVRTAREHLIHKALARPRS